MAKHFYFKFGESNCFFNICFPVEEVGELAELPIFFNNNGWSWRLADFQKNGAAFDSESFVAEASKKNYHSIEVEQIKNFIQLSQNKPKESFFWTFRYPQVFVFQMTGTAMDDISTRFDKNQGNHQYAKVAPAKCCRIFTLIELPIFFAALHANQRYNRRTLSQFLGAEHQYADFLMPDKLISEKLEISLSERLNFLSPIQFETLVFLIFHHAGIFCSTCRGGTVKDFDFKIVVSPESALLDYFPIGSFFIQLKMKNTGIPSALKDGFTIWLGESDFGNGVFGQDWIEKQLIHFPEVNNWLRQSLAFLSFR